MEKEDLKGSLEEERKGKEEVKKELIEKVSFHHILQGKGFLSQNLGWSSSFLHYELMTNQLEEKQGREEDAEEDVRKRVS